VGRWVAGSKDGQQARGGHPVSHHVKYCCKGVGAKKENK
jgi:hypothetical protein